MSDTSRPWRPTPLISASLLWHASAAGYLALEPSSWPLVAGSLAFNQLLLTGAGMWPRSTMLGSNWRRLPQHAAARREVAVTIDDGPDPAVTPQVLDILDAYHAKATFFCIGTRAQEQRALCQEIVRRGHAVENHSQNHLHHFALLGMRGIDRELREAQATLSDITGQQPLFFRAPAGLRSPLLEPLLARHNLQLASWTRRGFDTRERCASKVANRLLHGIEAGDILLLHDGNAARDKRDTPIVIEVLPQLLEAISNARLHPVTLRTALT
ncbi:MAG TPA: polysaccharide deacetylase family protein [Gammaproteobacteria bacterium]